MSATASPPTANPNPGSGMPMWLYGSLVGALVIALGFGVMAGLVWLTDRGSDPACSGEVDFGYEPDLTKTASVEPTFQVVDERCRAWFAVDPRGAIVAYKTTLVGHDCSVNWNLETNSWECGSLSLDVAGLEQWPLRINQVGDGLPTVVVNFGPLQ